IARRSIDTAPAGRHPHRPRASAGAAVGGGPARARERRLHGGAGSEGPTRARDGRARRRTLLYVMDVGTELGPLGLLVPLQRPSPAWSRSHLIPTTRSVGSLRSSWDVPQVTLRAECCPRSILGQWSTRRWRDRT